jgi:hypothetical protein
MTEGEYRVGISFNPGGHELVNEIKAKTAKLIDMCEAQPINGVINVEAQRCWDIAAQHYETAAMWAVKAATKPVQ